MLLYFLLFFSPLNCIADEVPRHFTPDTLKNFHGKGRLWFIIREKHSDRKSRLLPGEHWNCDLNFWGCRTQSFCSSSAWMLPLHFKLALVSLCWLLELILRMDNSTLSARALNTDWKYSSISHTGIAGILFFSVLMLECLTPDLVISF